MGPRSKNTKKVQAFLDSNGTATTHTAPNASQSCLFAERRFRQLMVSDRTAMDSAPHMPKHFWSYVVLDAAEKGNYPATAKDGKLQPGPIVNIQAQFSNAIIPSPASFLPRGKEGNHFH